MTQAMIYLGGKNIPILYPALLKDEMAERGWLNASLAAVHAATGSWADDPVDVATILHMRPLDQREEIGLLQPKKINRL
jgi:hypothetical protein